MPNIFLKCKNCGSKHLTVRSSQQITANTVASVTFCQHCHARNVIHSEIVSMATVKFTEQPDALRFDKPFNEVDPNQLEIDTE